MQAATAADGREKVRVMVVDDSAIVRGLIVQQLEADGGIVVAGRAGNGQAALLELDRVDVDVVVLDLEMPVMDGLTALPLILAKRPGVRVLIASTLSRRNARVSLEALQLGASDYVPKPDTGTLVGAEAFARELVAKVHALGRAPRPVAEVAAPAPRLVAPAAAHRPAVIAVGGSTGAPPVLMRLFEALRDGPSQPILVTQHMPPTFTAMLAEQLARAGGRPCAEGVDGEPVLPGRAYVAPGGFHMTVGRSGATPVIRLNQDPPEHYCRPAVDPMLRSLAEVYGAGVLAVVVTGMGVDGAEGCRAVAAAGGRFAVQDEATSVVWGMPGAAARTGAASAVLPPPALAGWIREAAR